MSADIYTKKFSHRHALTAAFVSLLYFSRKRIIVRGYVEALLPYNDRAARVFFYIVTFRTTLVGLDGIASLDLSIQDINRTCHVDST